MNILHIADYLEQKTAGVSNIVPMHVYWQNKLKNINAAILDLKGTISMDNIKIIHGETIKQLAPPFNNPDLVIFHEIYKPKYIKLYKECISCNIPYIIIPHGSITKYAQSRKRIKKIVANHLLFNNFISSSKAIQFLSENEKNNTKYNNKKYFIIGNGISDIPNKNMYLLNHQKNNNEKMNFIYVGRYDYYIKGLDQLLKTFKKFKNDNRFVLYLYGNGNIKTIKKIRKFISRNKLEKTIIFNGPIYSSEKRNEIISKDVFIQVSRTEGQPLGVMESISLGMPVLLSEGTGFKKIIKKYNIGLCTKTNNNDIYDTIIKLYNNRNNLNDYSLNGYKFAKENYNWLKVANESIMEYKRIIKR